MVKISEVCTIFQDLCLIFYTSKQKVNMDEPILAFLQLRLDFFSSHKNLPDHCYKPVFLRSTRREVVEAQVKLLSNYKTNNYSIP